MEPGDQLDDLPVLPAQILPCVEMSSRLWSLVTSWMTSLSSLLLILPCVEVKAVNETIAKSRPRIETETR